MNLKPLADRVVLRVNDNSIDGRENYYWVDFPGRPSLPESELVDMV